VHDGELGRRQRLLPLLHRIRLRRESQHTSIATPSRRLNLLSATAQQPRVLMVDKVLAGVDGGGGGEEGASYVHGVLEVLP
jgi:ABC-type branched-subunit amino acid transport system ATPase component